MNEIIYTTGSILTPILLYILAGYFASNSKWCTRKVIVSAVVGLCIGAYALYQGAEVSTDWIQIAFNSAPALGAMYLIDRIIKGIAKRYGVDWLYTDEPEDL